MKELKRLEAEEEKEEEAAGEEREGTGEEEREEEEEEEDREGERGKKREERQEERGNKYFPTLLFNEFLGHFWCYVWFGVGGDRLGGRQVVPPVTLGHTETKK